MAIDLGNNPLDNPPTPEEKQQIKNVLDLGNVENIAVSTWTGNSYLSISSSQILNFNSSVNSNLSQSGITSAITDHEQFRNDIGFLDSDTTITPNTSAITNIVKITSTNYNSLAPENIDSNTVYIIVP